MRNQARWQPTTAAGAGDHVDKHPCRASTYIARGVLDYRHRRVDQRRPANIVKAYDLHVGPIAQLTVLEFEKQPCEIR